MTRRCGHVASDDRIAAADALARLAHRGIGQADDVIAGQALGDVDLDGHDLAVDAEQGGAGDRREHGRPFRTGAHPRARCFGRPGRRGLDGAPSVRKPCDTWGWPWVAWCRRAWVRARGRVGGVDVRVRGSKLRAVSVAVVATCALALGTAASTAGAGPADTDPSTEFEFEDGETQQYVVPDGVCALRITAAGGDGGSVIGNGINIAGGLGGEIEATITGFTPGETLEVIVGGSGGDVDATVEPAPPGEGGENGGGDGGDATGTNGDISGAGGGGASEVRAAGDRMVVGAGGGGAGAFFTDSSFSAGGHGGGEEGDDGLPGNFTGIAPDRAASGGEGASDEEPGDGGTGGGVPSYGGNGEDGDDDGVGAGGDGGGDGEPPLPGIGVGGGGGGAGYHGGGGGGGSNNEATALAGGGGGGSSYAAYGAIDVSHDSGAHEGDGFVEIEALSGTCGAEAIEVTPNFTG